VVLEAQAAALGALLKPDMPLKTLLTKAKVLE
jgi:hypothetical protein